MFKFISLIFLGCTYVLAAPTFTSATATVPGGYVQTINYLKDGVTTVAPSYNEVLAYSMTGTREDYCFPDGMAMTKFFIPPHVEHLNVSSLTLPNNRYFLYFFYQPLDNPKSVIDINTAVDAGEVVVNGLNKVLFQDGNVYGRSESNTGAIDIYGSYGLGSRGGWLYMMASQAEAIGGNDYNPGYSFGVSFTTKMKEPFTDAMRNEILSLIPEGQIEPEEPPFTLITKNCSEPKSFTIETEGGSDVYCYPDTDNDTYGDSSATATVLSPGSTCPAGKVPNANDCNDGEITAYNGATEIIGDGIKQNCTDTSYQEMCYLDNDNDDWISSSKPTIKSTTNANCTDPKERSKSDMEAQNNIWDCDDNRDDKYPGATDIANDGIDQDCSGSDNTIASPVAPTNLLKESIGINEIAVSWTEETGQADNFGYKLQYKKSSDATYTTLPIPANSPTTIGGLDTGTSYDLRLYTYNDGGSSATSVDLTINTLADIDDDGIADDGTDKCVGDSSTLNINTDGDNFCDEHDNCPNDINNELDADGNQIDTSGNGHGDICDRDFISLHAIDDETSGSVTSLYYTGAENTIQFNKNVTFTTNELKLERMYIPVTATGVGITFTNTSLGETYVTIKSKFRAVDNFINLRYPLEYKTKNSVSISQKRIVPRVDEKITIENFEDLLRLDTTVLASGKSVSYQFDAETLKLMAPNGGWIYFVVSNTGVEPLNISYLAEQEITSKMDRYNLDTWIKNKDILADDAPNMLVYTKNDFGEGIVEEYIFENDYNTTGLLSDKADENYTSIHDIANVDGNRTFEARIDNTKYISHTYHTLVDQKEGSTYSNKFKAIIPKNFTDFSLFIATKPIDGELIVKVRYGSNNETYNMTNRMSIKFQGDGNQGSDIPMYLDIQHKGNQALGIMFEYKAKLGSAN